MAPPTENDLKIPYAETPAVTALWQKLGLRGRDGEAIVKTILDHFTDGFRYSIYQGRSERGKTPIQDFLERSRAARARDGSRQDVAVLGELEGLGHGAAGRFYAHLPRPHYILLGLECRGLDR